MADDEQFSLCWNNFNTNLSAGFHESLCRGDLVDVSLAAEGQIVKAHRLVLSVCSPFFRKMFTQMPSNTHAIVFLNNVSHSALKDLIQFMYCGEVNVKQDALPAFISTAESLQIKGLTDNDPAPQPPQEPTPPPAAPLVQQQHQQVPAQRVQRQQPRASARYKIETVDDVLGDEKGTTQIVIQTTAAPQATIVQQQQPQQQPQHIQTQQLQTATTTTATLVSTNKRTAQRSSLVGSGTVKRSKTTTTTTVIDPLDSATETANTTTTTQLAPQQITVQTTVVGGETKVHQVRQQHQQAAAQDDTEFIDLPMELPTKSEPDYSEDHAEVAGDGDTAYVEDDTYGDMRYDDSYFTENEDAGAPTASGGNTSTSVAATTSKAVIKQQSQSYSDSSFVDTGAEQGNTEAQAPATSTLRTQAIPPRKRGRPKTKVDDAQPKLKLLDKLKAATQNEVASKPAVYASTTKGGVKLVYEGHLFKFSFRKAEFSVFQCCFREHGEECKVRVVCDQKNVFPFDGEHVHFMQASDKSVTSSQFMPGGGAVSVAPTPEPKVEIVIQKGGADAELNADEEEEGEVFELHEIDEADIIESTGTDVAAAAAAAPAAEDENSNTPAVQTAGETIDPNDFREKIKRRLQKALQNKKK